MNPELTKFIISNVKNPSIKSELEVRPRLLSRCTVIKLAKGQVLFEQGALADDVFFVLQGSLKISRCMGRFERTLTIISEGEIGGVLLIRKNAASTYPGSIIALTSSVVLLIPKKTFLEQWNNNSVLNDFVQGCVQFRIQNIHNSVSIFEGSVEERLARFLLDHYVLKKDLCGKKVPRRQIALAIGTQPETVIRKLKKFELLGIISITQISIYEIKNEALLREMAHD